MTRAEWNCLGFGIAPYIKILSHFLVSQEIIRIESYATEMKLVHIRKEIAAITSENVHRFSSHNCRMSPSFEGNVAWNFNIGPRFRFFRKTVTNSLKVHTKVVANDIVEYLSTGGNSGKYPHGITKYNGRMRMSNLLSTPFDNRNCGPSLGRYVILMDMNLIIPKWNRWKSFLWTPELNPASLLNRYYKSTRNWNLYSAVQNKLSMIFELNC